jgi:diguanylate cyclase (GGDEF)-like protein
LNTDRLRVNTDGLRIVHGRPFSLVNVVAAKLVSATAPDARQVSRQVVTQLVRQLDVDAGFLRHNDPALRASVLVAEWPPRPTPNSDPLAIVPFAVADPVFSVCAADSASVVVVEPDRRARSYALAASRHVGAPSVACAPLRYGQSTAGMLGFVKFRRRNWTPEELETLVALACLFANLRARVAAEERLHYLADHDELTGLRNRRALVTHLSERLAAADKPVSVLYLDLDRLKSINDTLGHTVGDFYIQVFAERLRTGAGSDSMAARVGGDEFVVVPGQAMSTSAAEAFANRLRRTLCQRLTIAGDTITPTVSIGVAIGVPGSEDRTDLLLGRADKAVLAAKRAGGNRVAVSTGHVSDDTALRADVELYAKGNVDQDALVLHYLPEVDLWSGAITAAEALVRWRHPQRGLLLPESFIGAAESMNIAEKLGRWVLRNACSEFSRWRSHGVGRDIVLRVNVSPVQLVSPGFVSGVAEVIEEFGIDSGSMCLEITERTFVRDIQTTRRILRELKEIGVQIAVDDFGTGHAVFAQLKSLPVDILKIDMAFVRDVDTSATDLAVVRAIIGLADAFGLQVVAEGVETAAAAMTLMQNGCHRAHGYLLSRPLTGDAIEPLLSAGRIPMPYLADNQALTPGAAGRRQPGAVGSPVR